MNDLNILHIVLTPHLQTVHIYCPYELVFSKLPNSFHQFNELDRITPLYKFRLEVAYQRARQLLDRSKLMQKLSYDKKTLSYELNTGDLVILRNESGHNLDTQYRGPYKVKKIGIRNNVTIKDKKTKKRTY